MYMCSTYLSVIIYSHVQSTCVRAFRSVQSLPSPPPPLYVARCTLHSHCDITYKCMCMINSVRGIFLVRDEICLRCWDALCHVTVHIHVVSWASVRNFLLLPYLPPSILPPRPLLSASNYCTLHSDTLTAPILIVRGNFLLWRTCVCVYLLIVRRCPTNLTSA